MSLLRRHRKKLIALAALVALPFVAHALVGLTTRVSPPPAQVPSVTAHDEGDVRRTPRAWTAVRGVRIVYLSGSPEEIGAAHSALVHEQMAATERVVWEGFTELVPLAPMRTLLFDIGRVRYRSVGSSFPEARQRELAAQARLFVPDPHEDELPTYQRMVMLHALYDISLGFEHSPLLGCSAFGLGPEITADGHALFARVFDFEAAEVFDRDKAVFVVHEDGKIPFASVAWPGFIGVVTGMNAEGVAVAVHGGRAREPSTQGWPVAFSLRETLSSARSTAEAIAVLSSQEVMVSHLVFVGDGTGHFAVVERAPGVPAHVHTTFARPATAALTNHFEGPLASDPRNERVRATTTTLARRERLDTLLGGIPPKSATVASALATLRDHECTTPCAVGDRRAIDAFIATHGIVADLTTRSLWISTGPRLSGRFVKMEPALLVSRGGPPEVPPVEELEYMPPDPALADGRYREGRARAGGPLFHPDAKTKGAP